MKNYPLVSVLIPAFNASEFIEEAVNSITAQSYRNIEIIVIDDCSSDGTHEKLLRLQKADDRIKVYKNKINLKITETLNLALSFAKGELIARMDSDDISLPDRLLKQVEFLDQHPTVGLLGGAMEFFGADRGLKKFYLPREQKKILATFYCYNPFFHPTVMFRKQLVKERIYDTAFPKYEDYAFWIDMIGACEFRNISDVLVRYRRHSNNITNTYKDNSVEDRKLFTKLLAKLTYKLKVTHSDEELEILSVISTDSKAKTNPNISVEKLGYIITNVIDKTNNTIVDRVYLKQLLIERCMLYLKSNNRKSEILSLIKLLKAGKETIAIAKSFMSGRKWVI